MDQSQIQPEAEKRSRAYKWKYVLARRIAAGALALFMLSLGLLFYVLKGNLELQRQVVQNKSLTTAK